jgi:hypothetical protein
MSKEKLCLHRPNKEFQNLHPSPNIIRVSKTRRMR